METVDESRQTVVLFVGSVKGDLGLRPNSSDHKEPNGALDKPTHLVFYGTVQQAMKINKRVFLIKN